MLVNGGERAPVYHRQARLPDVEIWHGLRTRPHLNPS
jgi:hypothetical protein